MEVSQHAYDMVHYKSELFGYFYVCEIYVNLIWYLYLFMLNKFCLSLSLRPRQNGRHFTDDNFRCILLNENILILLRISLKFVREVRINNIPALVQIMGWRRSGDKPLSGTIMVSLLTHICVTRPQWVNIRSGLCQRVISCRNVDYIGGGRRFLLSILPFEIYSYRFKV